MRRFARQVVLPWALTRLALSAVGLAASSRDWLAIWSNWDAGWYLRIAQEGYSYRPGEQSSVASAPGLPLLMHLGGLLAGSLDRRTLLIAGLVVTNLGLLIALGYLDALVRLDFPEPVASRAVRYLLVWPSTLFLSAVYPHALFLAAAIAAMYYARRGRWWWAGALGGLAALMRTNGALLLVPLAYDYLASHDFGVRRMGTAAFGLGLVPLGWLLYGTYLFALVGDPLLMFSASGAWMRHVEPPWATLAAFLAQPLGAHGSNSSPLDLAFTLLLGALVGLCWWRLRPGLALLATVFFVAMLSTGLLVGSMRYGLELFPVFIVLAISSRHRLFDYAYTGIAGYLALRFMAQFAQGVWIA
jgi:hypothetical protein